MHFDPCQIYNVYLDHALHFDDLSAGGLALALFNPRQQINDVWQRPVYHK